MGASKRRRYREEGLCLLFLVSICVEVLGISEVFDEGGNPVEHGGKSWC